MCPVKRGHFVHEITVQGTVESANNVEVRCEVKARNFWRTTILEIVSEGTRVQPGDFLLKLDSSPLEELRNGQQIICNSSEAALVGARTACETANSTREEYLQGQYELDRRNIESSILLAQERQRAAREYYKSSLELERNGHVTKSELAADVFALKSAEKELDAANTNLSVLREFTRKKRLKQLESEIITTKAHLEAVQQSHRLDMEYLAEIEEQIKKCIIRAPASGQVVYAHLYHRGHSHIIEEGASVRQRQIVIRLPDPKQMQIRTRIGEDHVAQVDEGMRAAIRLDALPEVRLEGQLQKVDEYPKSMGWFGSNVKQYEAIISIDASTIKASSADLRPGLTAEATICLKRLEDRLQVPFQAVFKHGDKDYCLTLDRNRWQAHAVELGPSDGKFVVIGDGLGEGRQLVLNAAAYRDKVDLPELPPEY